MVHVEGRNGQQEFARWRQFEEPLRALLAQPGGFYDTLGLLLRVAADLAADYGGRAATVYVGGPTDGSGPDVEAQRRARTYAGLVRALRRAQKPAWRVMTDLSASGRRGGAL
jgi:hypothetical protein